MDELNKQDEMEDKMVNDAFDHLIESYLASPHRKKVEIITKAFNFAKHAHKGVRRLSGEPYIMHPLAVAQIVCEDIGLGSTSICSALLHDVVEDTHYTVEDISNIFGPKIAQIVDGLTKISGGIFGDNASAQAENFKKLLLTMSEDIRVILIKIADRLHNMRTLGSQRKNKQYKIAGETLYIYAPLAHRLGLNKIKSELENLSFRFEHPTEYENIVFKLANTEAARKTVFDAFTAPIRARLDSMGIKYEIKQRIKTPYSIWMKMQNKHVPFEEIYDILAVRIIFDPSDLALEKSECFNIYVALTNIYDSHPDRIRDWVTHPKANGYQALHVTLMFRDEVRKAKGEWIEVQIRSRRMDEIAEKGFAAHWKYKDGDIDLSEVENEKELDKWLTTIKEILDDPQPNDMDFLNTIKLNLYASEIFVFTPKGEIRTLPAGSTALDFAFTIHTFVGSHCIGAKVNHKLVPMSHKLQSGDQVEVLTSKSQHVDRSWLNIATTAKATTKIMAMLRREERDARKRGEEMVDEFFTKNDIPKNSSNIDKICRLHQCQKPDVLYAAVGAGNVKLGDDDVSLLREKNNSGGWKRLFSFGRKKNLPKVEEKALVEKAFDRKKVLMLDEDSIQNKYALSECCKPIPGDPVMGYIDDNNHVVIHKLQCPVAARLKANHGNRVLAAEWSKKMSTMLFPVTIFMRALDHMGLLNEITQVISQEMSVNMHKLTVEVKEGIFECTVQLFVHNTNEVDDLLKHLQALKSLDSVSRI